MKIPYSDLKSYQSSRIPIQLADFENKKESYIILSPG